MYKGLIFRAIRAGIADHIYAELVHANDVVHVMSGSKREIVHEINVLKPRGAMVGVYAVVRLANGLTDFEILDMKDIESIKAASDRMNKRRNKDAAESPAWRFYPGEMAKKSAIRRLCKRLQGERRPTDEAEAQRLASVLGHDDTKFNFDAEGSIEVVPDPPVAATTNGADVPAKPAPRKVVAEPDRGLSIDEQDDVMSAFGTCGIKASKIPQWLSTHGFADSLAEIPLSDLDRPMATMQESVTS